MATALVGLLVVHLTAARLFEGPVSLQGLYRESSTYQDRKTSPNELYERIPNQWNCPTGSGPSRVSWCDCLILLKF